MENDAKTFEEPLPASWIRGLGGRLLAAVSALFLVTLVAFVAMDLRHERATHHRHGAPAEEIRAAQMETLRLHAWHGLVTLALFAAGIYLTVRVLITRRIRALLLAIHRFRLGSWHMSLPKVASDEIDALQQAFLQLGPHLERNFKEYCGAERKAAVGRLGLAYERTLTPLARRLLTLARVRSEADPEDWGWLEVEDTAMRLLAQIGILGRPDHPVVDALLSEGNSIVRSPNETEIDPDPAASTSNSPEPDRPKARSGGIEWSRGGVRSL
jgi:HAMP domain-containing protein